MRGTRRQFLSAALIGLSPKTDRPIAGGFIDDGHELGHQVRDRAPFPAAKQTIKIPIVIVGGGIAGLSAAWRLDKRGFGDFVLLEMQPRAGGNARWGENEISAVSVGRALCSRYRVRRRRWCVSCSKIWACCATASGRSATCAFLRRNASICTAAGRKALSPSPPRRRGIARTSRVSSPRVKEFRATGEFTIPMELGAKPSPLDRLSMAQWLEQRALHVALSQLVRQLRLPRRFRSAGHGHFRVGRHPLLRLARAGRKRSAYLARGQWLDRAPPA